MFGESCDELDPAVVSSVRYLHPYFSLERLAIGKVACVVFAIPARIAKATLAAEMLLGASREREYEPISSFHSKLLTALLILVAALWY